MIKNVTFSNTSKSDTHFLAFTQCYLKHYFVSHQLMYSKVYYTVKAVQVNIRQGDQSKTLSLYIEPHKTYNTSVGSVLFFFSFAFMEGEMFSTKRGSEQDIILPKTDSLVSQSQISSLKTSPKDKKI